MDLYFLENYLKMKYPPPMHSTPSQSSICVFTDGACSGNPGPGGWGAIILMMESRQIIELGAGDRRTTNNRMELTAAIEALKKIRSTKLGRTSPEATSLKACSILIFTDSSYVIQGISSWIRNWKLNQWKTKQGTPVVNQDLWQALDALSSDLSISWEYVKGHAGIAGNERADQIAVAFSLDSWIDLFEGTASNYPIPLDQLLNTRPNNASNSSKISSSSKKARSQAKAYSYLSLVGGTLERHTTWEDCERRIRGRSGAKFKKALSAEEETEILKTWKVSL